VLAGLDPYAGFLHVDRSGKPVLAFDFVEMFRFAADLSLLYLLKKGWRPRIQGGLLDYESCRKIVEAPITLRQAMKKAALALASYLRGDGVFEGFVYRW